jgi:hypothetical protein
MAESHTKGPYPQKVIDFPTCGRWDCDDEYDWEVVTPSDVNYAAIKREQRIAYYHHPRDGWMRRLQAERDKRNGGEPLWMDAPAAEDRPTKEGTGV